jgi:hypothetical protein
MRLLLFFLLVWSGSCFAIQTSDVIGTWRYVSYLYHGQINPLPNPDLELLFKFDTKGIMTISWTRKNDTGFCEAESSFQIVNNQLISQVTKTNPKNTIECSMDPDMQVGKKSTDPIELRDNQLFLNIGLSGEDFYYIFDLIDTNVNPRAQSY